MERRDCSGQRKTKNSGGFRGDQSGLCLGEPPSTCSDPPLGETVVSQTFGNLIRQVLLLENYASCARGFSVGHPKPESYIADPRSDL